MSELTFCKQFLNALDSRAVKLSSDHIADPKKYPAQSAYTLPRLSNPKRKRTQPSDTAAATTKSAISSLTVNLKPTKPGLSPLTVSGQELTTSVFDLKSAYSKEISHPVDKIKILYSKKPVADTKTLRDILGDEAPSAKDVEFSVMVMGTPGSGASQPTSQAQTPAAVDIPEPTMADAPGSEQAQNDAGKEKESLNVDSGAHEIETEEFWNDLKGFLVQRLRDESEGERISKVFRNAIASEKIKIAAAGEGLD